MKQALVVFIVASLHVVPSGCVQQPKDEAAQRLEEVIQDYSSYAERDVVVQELFNGGEGIVINVPDDPTATEIEQVAVRLAVPAAERGTEEELYVREMRTNRFVRATVRGRLHRADQRVFGHLACCRYELEVRKVLSVETSTP